MAELFGYSIRLYRGKGGSMHLFHLDRDFLGGYAIVASYDLTIKCFNEIIENYKETFAIPEAIFYLGATRFFKNHDPKVLKEGLLKLRKEFPDSEWELMTKPYELI